MKTYNTTRYSHTPKRRVVWEEICRFLNRSHISASGRVLEIGCGYGDFIGNIKARSKTGIEFAPAMTEHVARYGDVELLTGDAAAILPTLAENAFDTVFCSNYFEHFTQEDITLQLVEISRILGPGGKLVVVQPNYRLCASNYFDDYTHKSVFSDASFADFLAIHGFEPLVRQTRFLPFSLKSRLPVNRLLVRCYLHSPIKPMAGQFLIVAANSKQ